MNANKLKQVAKKAAKRPILQCVNYDKDFATYTNSYFLVKEKQRISVPSPINVNMVTMALSEGNYPDVSKIFPDEDKLLRVEKFDLVVNVKGGFYIATHENGTEEKHFSKVVVEDAFGCLGMHPFKLELGGELFLTNETFPKLIYINDITKRYALILGVRTD